MEMVVNFLFGLYVCLRCLIRRCDVFLDNFIEMLRELVKIGIFIFVDLYGDVLGKFERFF